jgi:hypothetical protein
MTAQDLIDELQKIPSQFPGKRLDQMEIATSDEGVGIRISSGRKLEDLPSSPDGMGRGTGSLWFKILVPKP